MVWQSLVLSATHCGRCEAASEFPPTVVTATHALPVPTWMDSGLCTDQLSHISPPLALLPQKLLREAEATVRLPEGMQATVAVPFPTPHSLRLKLLHEVAAVRFLPQAMEALEVVRFPLFLFLRLLYDPSRRRSEHLWLCPFLFPSPPQSEDQSERPWLYRLFLWNRNRWRQLPCQSRSPSLRR